MTAAEYLSDWKYRHGLTDKRAAAWCRLSVSAFRRQRRGEVLESRCQQTVALAEFYLIHGVAWPKVAEAAIKIGRLIPPPR